MKFNFLRIWSGFWGMFGNKLFCPVDTGKIAENLYAIRDQDINLFIYSDGVSTICIDAGYFNNYNLDREFEQVGIDPAAITHLFLTHADMDHAGGIDRGSRTGWFDHAQIFFGKDEQPLIDRSIPRSHSFLNPVEITRKYTLLSDSEVVKVGAVSVQAIFSPGHTLGHTAYLINGEILCSGDALVLKDGKIEPFYRTWNMDPVLAEESAKKLAGLENISVLCTAHTKCSCDFKGAVSA